MTDTAAKENATEAEELRKQLNNWHAIEAQIHTALFALAGEDLYCKALAQICNTPQAEHNPILAYADEITAKNKQIEQLQRDLQQSHAAYNAIFDKAVELERRLNAANIPNVPSPNKSSK